MSYFGGVGAGKGWNKYFFGISSDEFYTTLSDKELYLVKGPWLPIDFQNPSLAEYLEIYKSYINDCKRCDMLDVMKATGSAIISLTASMEIYRIIESVRRNKTIKSLEATEPLVNLGPSTITYDSGKLITNVVAHNSMPFGLEMSYPKVVFFNSDGCTQPHETSSFTNAHLYDNIRESINRITRPCKIESPSGVHKTRFRVSNNFACAINESPMMRARGLKII